MSRGGRGGGPAGVGRMNGQALPFDVDTALEDQVALNAYQNDDWANSMFPPMNVHMAPASNAYEKKLVQHMREINEDRRNSPFFLGDATGKRDASTFNAFEDVDSYTNKRAKRIKNAKPDLDNVPLIREILPPELHDLVTDGEDPTVVSEARAKKLAFLKKSRKDRLARFDEGADLDPAADDDDDEAKDGDGDGEDDVEAPSDNDFSEDDSDMGDDYNAEKYFDDGEDDDDGGGGDEGGGEDWAHEKIKTIVNQPAEKKASWNIHRQLAMYGTVGRNRYARWTDLALSGPQRDAQAGDFMLAKLKAMYKQCAKDAPVEEDGSEGTYEDHIREECVVEAEEE